MKKITALFLLIFSLIACQSLELSPNSDLPFDPNIQHGKLSNGLQYFVLKNTEPKERVYIRLVINAGSMHEDDDQKGIAHLVEHMAFNGSKKYPENQIINALEKLGMKFARDINAFTDFENTVYTLNLDSNNQQKLELAFDVINEWINNITFLPKDVDGERGVVQEEWRRRLSPMLRIGNKKSAIEMAGSRYVLRDPIGDMDIIKTISAKRVADFYHKWYRPDNMSVIIVGDIDTKQVVKLLKQSLSQENPITKTTLEKIDFNIPLINKWRLDSISEQGTTIPSIELSFFENTIETNTLASYKQELIQQITTRLLNLRLQQWEKETENGVDSANFYRTHLGKETLQSIFSLQLIDTQYSKTIDKLFAFIASIKQQGFTQNELNGEIKRLTQLNEKQLNIRSGSLKIADDLITSVANKQVVLSVNDRYELNKRFLSQITLADLQRTLNQTLALKAKLLLITQPLPQKALPFDVVEIETRWNNAMEMQQHQWDEKKQIEKLPHLTFNTGSLSQEKYWDRGDIYEFRLSNGSKLIYHYSDKTPNQVHFRAVTQGGLRSIPDKDYHLLRAAVNVVDETGVGELSLSAVNQIFSRDPLVIATVIDDDKQGFTGVSKPKDLENLLTLFRLKLRSSPISDLALEKYRRETRDYFKQIDLETQFMQAVSKLRFPNIETVYTQKQAQQLAFDKNQLSNAYQRYILNKTDFTYFIIGDIELNQVKKLAERYLASVESKTQIRHFVPTIIHTPTQSFMMNGLKEPRADVEIYLTADNTWRAEQKYLFNILADIVQEKLRLILREKVSGVYSVNSWFMQDVHTPQIEGKIEFSCDPKRVEELTHLTNQVLDDIVKNGIDENLLRKKLAEQHTQIRREFDSLVSVASIIEESYWQQDNPDAIYTYQHLDQLATKATIDALAQKALKKSGRFVSILKAATY
ncbi:TPA: insulinase family protein [Haemophilus influenzae]|uniref:M16 family metallopeptidase n=1 Tax=Haemophilus influenzae TaxID=727 RepID=UPI0006823B97|nr:insulinase family protein [Haemophilus influenzae]KMZ28310.1 peptidase M16 [Haemophilus influenzae]MCK8917351.1 insulinase family protein [Haemophilus influenzae]MCK9680020.1 insulinase family protein [Haemophilus influenzae]ORJ44688.1 peptidase M16 [Haemophilus influenzae]RFO62887.1 insulinase family protein [Haemophilus influenzae]